MNTCPTNVVLSVLIVSVGATFATADDKPQVVPEKKVAAKNDDAKFKIQVGGKLPFHVVDFCSGKKDEHAGCPSVMIKNSRARGLVIWSKGLSAGAQNLARETERWLDGEKKQGYYVAFDVTEEALREHLKKSPPTKILAGNPRHSSAEQFRNYDFDGAASQWVFLLDGGEIKQMWTLKADELTSTKQQEILKVVEQHFADAAPAAKP